MRVDIKLVFKLKGLWRLWRLIAKISYMAGRYVKPLAYLWRHPSPGSALLQFFLFIFFAIHPPTPLLFTTTPVLPL